MAFDFMKNFLMYDDDERFVKLCETIEEAIHEANEGGEKFSDSELMQALDYVGFNLCRDDWEEFKKMEFMRDLENDDSLVSKGRRRIH
jgi:hypothetical protein